MRLARLQAMQARNELPQPWLAKTAGHDKLFCWHENMGLNDNAVECVQVLVVKCVWDGQVQFLYMSVVIVFLVQGIHNTAYLFA